jgi:uncharacterized protein
MLQKKSLTEALPVLAVVSALLVSTGCVSGNKTVDSARAGLRVGNDPVALEWAESKKHSWYSKPLGYVETGRVRMLAGDFLGSSTNLSVAIDAVIDETAEGPVLKMGDVGASVMAGTITDDRTRPYDLPAYEFIQALNYQMLNYVFLGKIDSACVEARRAVFAQDAIAEKYAGEVEKKRLKEEERAAKAAQQAEAAEKNAATAEDESASMTRVNQEMARMAPVLEKSRCSYENALAWYLCGALLEEQGDQSNAALSYRKANELTPHNPYIRRDFLRTLATQDQAASRTLMQRYKLEAQDVMRAPAEIIVIFEESFVPQRKSVKIPLPVAGTLTSADIPFYEEGPHNPIYFEVAVGDRVLGGGSEAVNIQALAYHDLKEKMPGVVLRNVTRIGTRIAAQQIANHAGGSTAKYTVMAFNAISTVVNKADTRAWYTLPAIAYLTCHPVDPGRQTITLRNPATGYRIDVPVEVAPGERRIIWIADIEGCSRVGTASLNGRGAPPSFMVADSLLTGPRMLTTAK